MTKKYDIITSKVKKIKEDPTATSLKTDKTTTKKEKVLADANDDKNRTKESETKTKKMKASDYDVDAAMPTNLDQQMLPIISTDLPIDMEAATTVTIVKPKHKTLSFQEDPMQFHAKPRDLAKNALKRPREMDTNVAVTNHIFSRVSFSALPLDVRLSGLLEKSTAEVSTTFYY